MSNQQAQTGDTVAIQYIGTLDNGRIFDRREGDSELEITLGQGQVFSTLEQGIIGMKVGQVKNIILSAEEAYGQRQADNILELKRSSFPQERELRIGEKISLSFTDGSSKLFRLIECSDTTVKLDGNHALAGQELTFALKLAAIRS